MKNYTTFSLLVCSLIGITLSGCNGKVASVSGTVKLDNKPLEGAQIKFQPVGKGRPSNAITNSSGYYVLKYTPNQNGAEVGKHKVYISTGVQGDGGEIKDIPEKLPAKYHAESTLEKEVTAGSNTIDFNLTSK